MKPRKKKKRPPHMKPPMDSPPSIRVITPENGAFTPKLDTKALTLLEPDSIPNFSGVYGKLSEIIQFDHSGYQRMIAAISLGAYPKVVAEAFGISSPTFSKWVQRGTIDLQAEKDTLYSRFTCDVRRAIAKCRADVECEVRIKDPKHWLRSGPGKILSDEWSENTKRVDHSGRVTHDLIGEINHSGTITNINLKGSDLASVIRELAEAGLIDLNERSTQFISPPEPETEFNLESIDDMEEDVRNAILEG